ncbi:hypothetical protein EDD68_1053 [Melghiribacillus thermohalophilus]|uniref:Uncharacterized protein n=1 Tax=Melghiribacillus thermohalophilus TaxID=1324956 RepID=A0A4R3N7W5_9BACI|nr:hypothetical protein EDD68_1053 [Melghiribacillus thermohalophilus]
MHHFFIMYAPFLVVILSIVIVFVWGAKSKSL